MADDNDKGGATSWKALLIAVVALAVWLTLTSRFGLYR